MMANELKDPGAQLRARFGVAEMLNTICHDVRATLSVTAGSAAELTSPDCGPLTDMQRQLISIIQRGNIRLARLAGNLMVLADLWDGTLELRPTRVDAAALVREAVDELGRQDPANRARFDLRLPDAAVTLDLDVERFRQMLANVLGIAFAVAHTVVTVSLAQTPDAVELTVEDDGPERRRGPATTAAKRVSSTELAMSVCEGLIRAQGGSLIIESPVSAKGGARSITRLPKASV
jgi:signal transduction histidine kinase